MPQESSTINCIRCEHFFVTWQKEFPKGCRLFKFKTKGMPSKTVFEATGKQCEHFAEKAKQS
jgi:hypothetical protein